MTVVVNPGTGPVEEATLEDATANVEQLVADVAERRGVTFTVTRVPGDDRDGRYGFLLTAVTERRTVRMPGLPLELVRFTYGPGHPHPSRFPRLYVDGSSWWWPSAVNMLEIADEDDDA